MKDKFLVITPKYGLCNQLLSISKGIIFGLITNRNVIFTSFQLDYRNVNNTCDFHDIIDIEHLKKIIIKNNIDVNIYSLRIDCKKVITNTDTPISYIKEFIPILMNDYNINEKYLDIENPISSVFPIEYNNIYNIININLKFNDKFINIANTIKNNLNLINYSVIHLRLEDDSINFLKNNSKKSFEEINEIYIKKYIKEIDLIKSKNSNNPIYICSSLIIDNNVNNNFYKDLKKKYNLIDKNDYIKLINIDIDIDIDIDEKCREINAIIDFIIAKDGIYFVGSDWSSFSMYLYNHYHNINKACFLINIWDTIVKK
jgi:hypothetical protein